MKIPKWQGLTKFTIGAGALAVLPTVVVGAARLAGQTPPDTWLYILTFIWAGATIGCITGAFISTRPSPTKPDRLQFLHEPRGTKPKETSE